MAISHSTQIAAVGYLRRSTRKQEKSIADQKRAIEQWADGQGYRIVRWYIDDGISGDSTEQRADFLRMRSDTERGDFEAVLCWDQDRFGRFDSLDAGYWIKPFRDAGVTLVTLNEGPINWNDFAGRLMYNIKQEGKHQFLRDLSRNTARGQITNALNGYLCGQAAPYGYDRMLVDVSGEHRQRVGSGEQIAKPRSWHVTLVLSDDPERVETAKWLFQTYAETDIGLRSMANELNRRGVPGPGGGAWWIGTIREILKRPVYAGDFIWPQRRMGKYHRVAGTEIKERDPSERRANGQPLVRDNFDRPRKRCSHSSFASSVTLSWLADIGRNCERGSSIVCRHSTSSDEGQVNRTEGQGGWPDKEIRHGTRRLLRAPDAIADLLADELSAMKRERDRLAAGLQRGRVARPAAKSSPPPPNLQPTPTLNAVAGSVGDRVRPALRSTTQIDGGVGGLIPLAPRWASAGDLSPITFAQCSGRDPPRRIGQPERVVSKMPRVPPDPTNPPSHRDR